jgi:cbb3-type cytochrome oxidase maturation protein
MEAIYILLTVSMLLGALFLVAFIRATRDGQFDDAQTPAWRVLHEDPPPVSAPVVPPKLSPSTNLMETKPHEH